MSEVAAHRATHGDSQLSSRLAVWAEVEPANRQQNVAVAASVALIFHAAIILGIGFRELLQPSRQPAYSLNVSLIERVGGSLEAAPSGKPEVAPPVAVPETAEAQPAVAAEETPVMVATVSEQTEITPVTSELAQEAAIDDATQAQLVEPMPPAQPVLPTDVAVTEVPRAAAEDAVAPRAEQTDEADSSLLEGFYAERWRLHVEAVGSENYPARLRESGLSGRLTLDVAISADGGVKNIQVLQSSGNPVVDRAARQIVYLAAPFDPFPDELRRFRDEIHIIRTWEFNQGSGLHSKD